MGNVYDAAGVAQGSGKSMAYGPAGEPLSAALAALTTKGDVLSYSGSAAMRRGVGAEGTCLVADPSDPTGLSYVRGIQCDIAYLISTAGIVDAAIPLLDQFLFGLTGHICQADLSAYRQARFTVRVLSAGFGGTVARLVYRTSFSTTVVDYASIAAAGACSAALDATGMAISGWVDLHASAKADVFLALVTSGGNGVLGATYGSIHLQFRR